MDLGRPGQLIKIVKNVPRKVTKAMDNSWLGQKMIDAGTQANGGIGRNISKEGNTRPLNVLFTAMIRPRGIPITMAAKNPASTRSVLIYQLCQKPGSPSQPYHATRTAVGAGTWPIHGTAKPNQSLDREPTSHNTRNTKMAMTARSLDRLNSAFLKRLAFISLPFFLASRKSFLGFFMYEFYRFIHQLAISCTGQHAVITRMRDINIDDFLRLAWAR